MCCYALKRKSIRRRELGRRRKWRITTAILKQEGITPHAEWGSHPKKKRRGEPASLSVFWGDSKISTLALKVRIRENKSCQN